MTLVEVAVYCVLLSIFSVVMFMTLPSRTSGSLEKLQEAAVTANADLGRMTQEMSNASASSIVVTSSPVGVIFLSAATDMGQPFTYTSSGGIAWAGWVGYFLEGSVLTRYWLPLKTAVARDAVGTVPTATSLISAGVAQRMKGKVNSLLITSPESNVWQVTIQVEVDGHKVKFSSGTGARN